MRQGVKPLQRLTPEPVPGRRGRAWQVRRAGSCRSPGKRPPRSGMARNQPARIALTPASRSPVPASSKQPPLISPSLAPQASAFPVWGFPVPPFLALGFPTLTFPVLPFTPLTHGAQAFPGLARPGSISRRLPFPSPRKPLAARRPTHLLRRLRRRCSCGAYHCPVPRAGSLVRRRGLAPGANPLVPTRGRCGRKPSGPGRGRGPSHGGRSLPRRNGSRPSPRRSPRLLSHRGGSLSVPRHGLDHGWSPDWKPCCQRPKTTRQGPSRGRTISRALNHIRKSRRSPRRSRSRRTSQRTSRWSGRRRRCADGPAAQGSKPPRRSSLRATGRRGPDGSNRRRHGRTRASAGNRLPRSLAGPTSRTSSPVAHGAQSAQAS
jgi:hypothetical protein